MRYGDVTGFALLAAPKQLIVGGLPEDSEAGRRLKLGQPGKEGKLAFTADDDTIVGVFTAQGIASVAEVILRYLVKSGEEEIARHALEQVLLEMSDESKPAKVIVPKNTIRTAKLLPPEARK